MLKLYDTTLRDGAQAEEISFSVEDKVRIAHCLDDIGIHYVEGGWPGSNPRDIEFFKAMRSRKLKNAALTAFGSTRRTGIKAKDDANIKALLQSGASCVTLVGKTWKLHVEKALRVPLKENLEMIFDSVKFLKSKVDKVFFDAEHFFDGFKDDPEYSMKTLGAAIDAGADCLVLCDTNGGCLPSEVGGITGRARLLTSAAIGIHAHNDSETAVANSIAAVEEGALMVQGTMNGFGERCGNANLCSIIPALKLKMKIDCMTDERLKKLREASRFVYELANVRQFKRQPYVGDSAFAHKGGIHVSAVLKSPQTYEHIRPELVGNHQRVLVSDLSGRSSILYKAAEFGVDLASKDEVVQKLLRDIKLLEHQGFQYEGAEASFELLIQKALKKRKKYFSLVYFRVTDEKRKEDEEPVPSIAHLKIDVGGKAGQDIVSKGDGPVNALDKALRCALTEFYPSISEVKLLDFKVRVLGGVEGTAARVRVLIESGDAKDRWGTVGVSENVIEASWQALADSLEYKLYKDTKGKKIVKAALK